MNTFNSLMNNVRKLTKNPIGIIALFITLIYGVAGLVLSTSNDQLSSAQNWTLVVFIVVFPFIVLAVFIYLVINHHQKLYSPADYRDENNFFRKLDKTEQKQRLKEKVESIIQEENFMDTEKLNKEKSNSCFKNETNDQENKNGNDLLRTSKIEKVNSNLYNKLYAIEEHLLRILEYEQNVNIKRQMVFDLHNSLITFDGVAFYPDEIIGIDVSYVPSGKINKNTILKIKDKIRRILNNKYYRTVFKFIFAFASDNSFVNSMQVKNAILNEFKKEDIDIDIRFYDANKIFDLTSIII